MKKRVSFTSIVNSPTDQQGTIAIDAINQAIEKFITSDLCNVTLLQKAYQSIRERGDGIKLEPESRLKLYQFAINNYQQIHRSSLLPLNQHGDSFSDRFCNYIKDLDPSSAFFPMKVRTLSGMLDNQLGSNQIQIN